jgi:hypothetical protein
MARGRERTDTRGAGPAVAGRPPLSPEHAFVVQFRAGARVDAGPCAGRVEHMRSGEAIRFETRDELLAFIARLLAGQAGCR